MRGEYPQDQIRYVVTVVGDAVSGEYLQDYIRYVVTVVGDAVSDSILRYAGPGLGDVESENVYKTIHDIRGRS